MKILVVVFLVIHLAGCAGGREFIRQEDDTFKLGSTTYNEIVKTYGEPRRTGTVTHNGITLKSINYSYARAVPFSTSLQTRAMAFLFNDDTLVSHNYLSSFEDGKNETSYSDEKVKQIAKGDNKSKVISILGKPSGEAIFPVVSAKGHSLFRYTFLETYRIPFLVTPRITTKVVTITFDVSDSVIDIASVESKPN
jgi:hypothetical protein